MSCCGNHHHESHQSGDHQHGTHQHLQDQQNKLNAVKEQNEQLRKELRQLKNEKS